VRAGNVKQKHWLVIASEKVKEKFIKVLLRAEIRRSLNFSFTMYTIVRRGHGLDIFEGAIE